jgi:hypothetical protein
MWFNNTSCKTAKNDIAHYCSTKRSNYKKKNRGTPFPTKYSVGLKSLYLRGGFLRIKFLCSSAPGRANCCFVGVENNNY